MFQLKRMGKALYELRLLPVETCLGYTLHSPAGEVAARRRRNKSLFVTLSELSYLTMLYHLHHLQRLLKQ
jgi:hypothetical protein